MPPGNELLSRAPGPQHDCHAASDEADQEDSDRHPAIAFRMNQPDTVQQEAKEPRSERALALQGSLRLREQKRSCAAIAVLLSAFPLFAISLDHWVSTIYYLVGLVCLIAISVSHRHAPPLQSNEKLFLWILAFYLAATLIANTSSGWTGASFSWYEADLRFMFAIPIFLFLRRYPHSALYLLRAAPVAAVLTGSYVIYETMLENARFEGAYGPIFAGNVAVLLAVISLATMRYDTYPLRIRIPLHLAGFVLALVAAVLSGTRSAWLAAMVALPIVLFFMAESGREARLRRRVIVGAATLVAAVLVAAVALEPRLTQHRFAVAVEQAVDFLSAEPGAERSKAADSSVGIRLEQWRIGLRIVAEHPVFGIGVGNVGPLINRYVEAGTASPAIYVEGADARRGSHLHSAYFDALVFKGVTGLVTLLAVLLYPLWLALRYGRGLPARPVLIGLSVSFLVFGLTEDPFIRNNFTSIYLLFLVCILVLLFSEKAASAGRGALQSSA